MNKCKKCIHNKCCAFLYYRRYYKIFLRDEDDLNSDVDCGCFVNKKRLEK